MADWLEVIGGPDPRPRAPKAMLATWTMPGYAATADGTRWSGAGQELLDMRAADDLTDLLAVSVSQTYDRPVLLGEVLTGDAVVDAVSAPKDTGVGPGRFVTFLETFYDAAGQRVGTQTMTLLYFGPQSPAAGRRPPGEHPHHGAGRLAIEITTSLVVASALAGRDFEPIHHDAVAATAAGAPAPILNTYAHLGFCERVIAEALGPTEDLQSIALTLASPAVAGDRVVYTLGAPDLRGIRSLHATSPRGRHLIGEVRTAAPTALEEGHRR